MVPRVDAIPTYNSAKHPTGAGRQFPQELQFPNDGQLGATGKAVASRASNSLLQQRFNTRKKT